MSTLSGRGSRDACAADSRLKCSELRAVTPDDSYSFYSEIFGKGNRGMNLHNDVSSSQRPLSLASKLPHDRLPASRGDYIDKFASPHLHSPSQAR